MNKQLFLLLFCIISISAVAQWKWYNPMDAGFPVIQNQGFTQEIGTTYTRLPKRAEGVVRTPVWNLSRNSTGLAIYFNCDASQIKVRYKVSGPFSMLHMPATGVSGIDMYRSNGEWEFCSGDYSFGDTIQYDYSPLTVSGNPDNIPASGFEYRIYLPLYNSVEWLEIGIEEKNKLTFIPALSKKPIVVYGTSIVQGGCASRPAMAWPNIVQRTLDYPLINLGFSGSGRLEKEVLDFVGEIDASLFILDCLPNLIFQSEEEIAQLTIDAVKQLRTKHTEPILLIEHVGYSNALTNQGQYECYTRVNKGSRKAYEHLRSEGVKELYYLSHKELNLSPDSRVDYVHPSDLGMQQQASAVEKKVRKILHIRR
ncbi:hypothetical protein DW103_07485 [Parabacteroides sp. AM08-6]|nr:SGNH/GDSL hydrolase family protein [Parabacteroides sp. AM08-6]RHJ83181.1 hypothetical protein DW103_07485 [Parabacteroides sp. AM08-6]